MKLDEELARTEHIKKGNWGKMLSVCRRQFEDWAMKRLAASGCADFKMAYMPVMMNVAIEGTNNNELATKVRVTKQAMSKVVKELTEKGYIKQKTSLEDKRVTVVMLTERGKKLVLNCRQAMNELTEDFHREFGKKNIDQMLDQMAKIVDYMDGLAESTK